MRNVRHVILTLLAIVLFATPAVAKEYYEYYEDGLKAIDKKDWNAAISLMTEAIGKEPEENKRARSYGANFFAYHPYYYRGIAYYNTGQYEKAIADLQRALGNGRINLGTPESWVLRAEQRILAGQQAAPPPTATPPPPTTPQVDPNLAPARKRAEDLMSAADQKVNEARTAKANTLAASDFNAAQQKLVDARSRSINAKTAADWNEVASLADQASRQFDLAISNARIAAAQQAPPPTTRPTTSTPTPPPARPTSTPAQAQPASQNQLKPKVREALNYYFSGQFDRSEFQFEQLSREADSNPMIWAFLGASRYSHYLLDGESREDLRRSAADAFRRAKDIKPGLRLDDRYFSSRIRNFYESVN
jgi:tetratricopeptide (TPR) repeat protein